MMRAVVVAGMFAPLALLTAGCNRQTEAPQPIRPVFSEIVEPQTSGSAAAVGTVEPRFKTDLSFRVLGRLIARPVNVGDPVGQGQIIAAIDATALELAVRSAKAEVSRTQAQFENANATEQRQRALITTDTTTKAALENAQQLRAGAEASVARAQANLTKALEQLGYATVKTDFAGVVTAVGADVGQVVSPGQTVVTVARPDIREAVVDIGPDFPVPLSIGLPFTVSLQLLPTIQIDGKIREIAPQADAVTRTVRVRIALSNPPPTFRLGTTVAATLADGQPSTLRVPASAVLTKDGQNFVWRVDAPTSTVSLRKVDLAEDEGGFRVLGGLEPGTRVVTAGIHSLKEGQKVRIEKDSTP
jgi:membrane fusion protein, multidrug efflux system